MSLVAIVGRPNVGKSTLFNRLVGMRQAIVDETAGVTRDRHYGKCEWCGAEFSVVDTGGWSSGSDDAFEDEIRKQVIIAIDEADVILFMVEAATGVTDYDAEIADILRRSRKPVVLCVNKVDTGEKMFDVYQFYSLGLGECWSISAANGSGTGDLLDEIVRLLPEDKVEEDLHADLPHIAIVGKPNVGKSSLTNALLGEDRAIVSPVAGTTRDTIEEVMVMDGVKFRFIDTAGLRETSDLVEKLGVERSLQKLRSASIVVSLVECAGYRDGMQWPGEDTDAHLIKVLSKCDLAVGGCPEGADSHIVPGECDLGEGGNWPEGVVLISAKTGAGMTELRRALMDCSGLAGNWQDESIVSSARHYNALCTAGEQLEDVLGAMRLGLPADLLAEHLRAAIASISSIIGEISSDQVLGEIFSKFCIGK